MYGGIAAHSLLGGQAHSINSVHLVGQAVVKVVPCRRQFSYVVVCIRNRNFASPHRQSAFVHDRDFDNSEVAHGPDSKHTSGVRSNACSLDRQVVSVVWLDAPNLVFDFTIFAQQNDDLGPSVLPVFEPSQFGAFPCEEGRGLFVLLDLAAIGYTEDRVLLVHGDDWNLLEEFNSIKRRYLWDERKHCYPLVLVVMLVPWNAEVRIGRGHSQHCIR